MVAIPVEIADRNRSDTSFGELDARLHELNPVASHEYDPVLVVDEQRLAMTVAVEVPDLNSNEGSTVFAHEGLPSRKDPLGGDRRSGCE